MKMTSLLAGLILAGACSSDGALSFTGSYSQDFNSLVSSGTAKWSDDSTISGWYADETAYTASSGSSTSGGLYSFGNGADRALGSLASGSTATVYYGVAFQNSLGAAITALHISYNGEQWRKGENLNTLVLEDFIGNPTAIGSSQSGWTQVSQLSFVSPQSGTTAPFGLDGNAAANSSAISYTVAGLNIASAGNFWIRWRDVDDPGNDAGLAVDDFSITAVPEPAKWGAISAAGLIVIGGVHSWRQKRRSVTPA